MKYNLKEFFAVLIYALIITSFLCLFLSLNNSLKSMEKDLENITLNVKNENWETSKNLFNEFNHKYKSKIEKFSILINHREVNEALLYISNVYESLDSKDKSVSLNKLSSLSFVLKNFYKSQLPNYKNIF